MPTILACPSCTARLNVPETLLDQQVRCPSCGTTFAPPPPEAASTAPTGAVEIKLSLDDDVPAASPILNVPLVPEPPRLREVPAEDRDERPRLRGDHDDTWECPGCGKILHRDARRCYRCGARPGRPQDGTDPRRPQRLDGEPHRGALILTLGILGMTLAFVCGPIGVFLSLFAWVLGHGDLTKIRQGAMDSDGESTTWGGWICGIIGTVVGSVWSLGCLSFWSIVYMDSAPPAPSSPRFGAPPAFQKDKDKGW